MAVYLLNRVTRQMEGTVGGDDTSATDQSATVAFVGDGKVLAQAAVAYTKPVKVSFDTTGILRLEVRTTSPLGSPVVLGDMLIKGAVDEMARWRPSREARPHPTEARPL